MRDFLCWRRVSSWLCFSLISASILHTFSSKYVAISFCSSTDGNGILKFAIFSKCKLVIVFVFPANAISVATIDNSDGVKVGQGVMAIGNALGLGQTTTFGHVSALNKDVTTSDDNVTRSMMQIDAAINAGNSGGGLFDANGHLIGINSAKSSGEGVEGMGYAIPISSVEDLINNMMNQKTKVQIDEDQRGYLGIQGVDVPTEYVQRFGMPEGAMVTKITEGSPASDAGLQLNDIITAVDGQKVSSFETLRSALSYYAAGESVTITVQRPNGNQYTETQITVTLADRSTITDTTEADTEEGSSEAETQEPQVQMQKAQ